MVDQPATGSDRGLDDRELPIRVSIAQPRSVNGAGVRKFASSCPISIGAVGRSSRRLLRDSIAAAGTARIRAVSRHPPWCVPTASIVSVSGHKLTD